MGLKDQGKFIEIKEGYIRKGGSNPMPTMPRPSTMIQGFDPPHSLKNNGDSSQNNQNSENSNE